MNEHDAVRRVHGRCVVRERERELDSLSLMIDSASRGAGGMALIEGSPGIGKSRLLAEARDTAATRGLRTLAARSSELEKELPFGVVRQLFEHLVNSETSGRWMSRAAARATGVFQLVDDASATVPSFTVLHGLYWLTANIAADRPLVMTVDDLQWCDWPSLRFITYLVRRLDSLPVLLLASLSTIDPVGSGSLLDAMLADDAVQVLRPRALTTTAVKHLVTERFGVVPGAALCESLHRATGGNPLLLHEMMREFETAGVNPDDAEPAVIDELGPQALHRTVQARLGRLGERPRSVAQAVAVLGGGATLAGIGAWTGLSETDVADATRALVAAEILGQDAPLDFIHPLIRDTVYRGLSPGERELGHEKAARVLAQAGLPNEQVAAHLLLAPPRGDCWVTEVLRAAARSAMGTGAARAAVTYLRRALAEPPEHDDRAHVLLDLGTAEALIEAPAAESHLRAAYDAVEGPVERAEAAASLARMRIAAGSATDAVAMASRAQRDLPPQYEEQRIRLAALEVLGTPPAAVAPLLERWATSIDVIDNTDGSRSMLAAAVCWQRALTGGSAIECVQLALHAFAHRALLRSDAVLFASVAASVLVLADRPEARGVWEEASAHAYHDGSLLGAASTHLWSGWAWLQHGELDQARTALMRSEEESRLWNPDAAESTSPASALLALVFLERGDRERARTWMERAGPPPPDSDLRSTLYGRAQIELLLAESRWAEAAERAEECSASHVAVTNPAWAPWRSLRARALEGLGRRHEAIALLEEELSLVRSWGAAAAVARSLRLLGMALHQRGIEHLEEAVALSAGSTGQLEHAKALAWFGRCLLRGGRPVDAKAPLRLAVDVARACGAASVIDQARADLYLAGGRPHAEARAGVAALTRSERRVAELAATGSSNRDIAEALFITQKTVEVHLSSVYRKLGIHSRTRLGAVLPRPA